MSAQLRYPDDKSDYSRIWCLDEAELTKGHDSMTRCRIDLGLSGFAFMPDTAIESESGVIAIRHFSVLAFYRFLYERLESSHRDHDR